MKPVSIALGNIRLLKLADYVERRQRAKPKAGYDQETLEHPCGAPACLLGHAHTCFPLPGYQAASFFGLSTDEVHLLFNYKGCNDARTNWRKAVRYVRDFVKRRQADATA